MDVVGATYLSGQNLLLGNACWSLATDLQQRIALRMQFPEQ